MIESLKSIVGADQVLVDAHDTAPYLTDWRRRFVGRALAVVRPANAEEVAQVVKLCAQARIAIIGTGLSAVSTIAGGIAAQNAANYTAQVARNNSVVAEQNAVRAEQAGYAAAENESRKGAAELARIKVTQAASGIDVNNPPSRRSEIN